MPLDWLDVSALSFNSLLLLEAVQLSWFPGWVPEKELQIALAANPVVEWYLRHKCPALNPWLDQVLAASVPAAAAEIRRAEEVILAILNDLIVYVVDPQTYDALPFLGWDDAELTDLVDFDGKTVIDLGSGTGRLALVAAEHGAAAVVAVEPVARLRAYILEKARARGLRNVYAVDGLIEAIQLPDAFAEITMGGHVFGDAPEAEYAEMVRVTKPGSMLVLFPGNSDRDNEIHQFLIEWGFQWKRFEEPGDGIKRAYWRRTDRPHG